MRMKDPGPVAMAQVMHVIQPELSLRLVNPASRTHPPGAG
jgi:hypothetical protein